MAGKLRIVAQKKSLTSGDTCMSALSTVSLARGLSAWGASIVVRLCSR